MSHADLCDVVARLVGAGDTGYTVATADDECGVCKRVLDRLAELGVRGDRLRVVTALASGPGLQLVGERHGDLTIYTAGIDPELVGAGQIVPGIGAVAERLFAGPLLEMAVPTA